MHTLTDVVHSPTQLVSPRRYVCYLRTAAKTILSSTRVAAHTVKGAEGNFEVFVSGVRE